MGLGRLGRFFCFHYGFLDNSPDFSEMGVNGKVTLTPQGLLSDHVSSGQLFPRSEIFRTKPDHLLRHTSTDVKERCHGAFPLKEVKLIGLYVNTHFNPGNL